MLKRAAAAPPELWTGRAPPSLPGRNDLQQRRRPALAALRPEPHADTVAGYGERHEDGLAVMAGDAVALRADLLDREVDGFGWHRRRGTRRTGRAPPHGGDTPASRASPPSPRRATTRNSLLPSGPRIGLSATPSTCQPISSASHDTIVSHTSRCSIGSRTTPPLPTRSFPTSNCGLIRATSRASGPAASASAAGSTVRRPMKLAAQTTVSGRSGIPAAGRWR